MPKDDTTVSITFADGSRIEDAPLSKVKDALDQVRRRKAPMRETPADKAVGEAAYRVSADELRAFVERYERLAAEKQDIADGQKELMAEAKGRGYDTRCLRKIIALRKRDRDDIAEEEAIMEMYRQALGM